MDSAQIRSSPMTSLNQHFPNQRSSGHRVGVAQRLQATWGDLVSHQTCVFACLCVSVCACRMESGPGDTNIHHNSRALVQSCSLKCRRVGLFQNTNVFWRRKRNFKGKPSLILSSFTRPEKWYFWHGLEAEYSINTKPLNPLQREPDQGLLLIS